MPSGAGTTITSRHAGDLGRHGVHQHRGRIGGGATGHVQPDRFDRAPAPADLDAERIGVAFVGRLLAAVIGLDPLARELERSERGGVARRRRCGDVRGRHAQPELAQIDAVVFGAGLDQGAVAALDHVGDDAAHGVFDVPRRLAFDAEKGVETLGKIGALAVQAKRHSLIPAGRADRAAPAP